MSDLIPAWPVDELINASCTEDGDRILVRLKRPDGGETALAIDPNMVLPLVAVLAPLYSQARAKQGIPKDEVVSFPAAAVNATTIPGSDEIALSFRLHGGGEMTIRLFSTTLPGLVEILQSLLGRAPTAPPGSKAH